MLNRKGHCKIRSKPIYRQQNSNKECEASLKKKIIIK